MIHARDLIATPAPDAPVKRPRSKAISPARLREVFDYELESGLLLWRIAVGQRARAGASVGSPTGNGYLAVQLDGVKLKVHRVVWAWVFGEWPMLGIDHIDGHGINNKLGNLRDASDRTNSENRNGAHKNSVTGLLGASPNHLRFSARIMVGGRQVHLGEYGSADAAHEAYVAAKRQMHAGGTL